jgi:hypothetical protein
MISIANAGYKNYTFRQNNSGGYFIGPVKFTVTAQSSEDAFKILQDQLWYSDKYCVCCGVRWSSCCEESEL